MHFSRASPDAAYTVFIIMNLSKRFDPSVLCDREVTLNARI
ncbi:MAG: hypothetical protein ABI899_06785 [Actinomycetota bacterium]